MSNKNIIVTYQSDIKPNIKIKKNKKDCDSHSLRNINLSIKKDHHGKLTNSNIKHALKKKEFGHGLE